jgi:hypothetical protein
MKIMKEDVDQWLGLLSVPTETHYVSFCRAA